jgi:D-glycero-D-manno-heptose 1,7-bisphosphate phosphatase
MNRAIFLDRDNTIIANDEYLGDPSAVRLVKGAASAISSLRGLGYKIVVVTNQSGVARGLFGEADVEAVHVRLAELVKQTANGAEIDRFYYCPYLEGAAIEKYNVDHPWRKPKPGMLLAAAKDMGLDLELCWMVGDAERDVAAGKAAGVRTILIGPAAEALTDLPPDRQPDYSADSLIDAARIIAQHVGREAEATDREGPVVIRTQAVPAAQTNPNAAPTFPAVHELGATQPSSHEPKRSTSRPFRPWSIQPRTDEDDSRGRIDIPVDEPPPSATPDLSEAPRAKAPQAETAGAVADRAEPADAGPPTPHEPTPDRPRRTKADVMPEQSTMPQPPETAPGPATFAATGDEDEGRPRAGRPAGESTDQLLRQLLRHFKQREIERSDWSLFKVLGVGVAQLVALACVVMGIVGGGEVIGNWLLGAIFMQLLVITCLLMHWQR